MRAGESASPRGHQRWPLRAALIAGLVLAAGFGILRLSSLLGVPPTASGAAGSVAAPPTPWTRLPLPPEVRAGAAHVWTGTELIAWAGCAANSDDACEPTAGGYAFHPVTETWEDLPAAPIAASEAAGVWTGTEALFLRFREDRPLDGAAYDPARESWHRIRAAPINAEYGSAEVWTGSELVVFGGGDRGQPTAANGAAYDPRGDVWRRIAEAPVGLNAISAMWTGRVVVALGSSLDDANHAETRTAVGAAYDPERDRWRELPPSALSPQATAAAWVGDRMVAWDYEARSQEYDPASDEWTPRLRMPFDPSECYPTTAATGRLVVAFYCGFVALYDPIRDAWTEVHGGLADEEIWSRAYERYLKLWRFADLVPAGDVLYLFAEGLTLKANGIACYGCPDAEASLWAYRSPEGLDAESSDPPVTPASAFRVAQEFMRARTLRAEGRLRRTLVRDAAAEFESRAGVPEPLLAGTSYSLHRPTPLAGRPGSFEVVVELTLKGGIGAALGDDEIDEVLVIGPGRTISGRIAPLAVIDVRPTSARG